MTPAASRRAVLAGLLAAPAIHAAAAQGAPIRCTLDWRFRGPNAVFLHANRAGYYRAEGLNVPVDGGQGRAGAIQRIVGGAYEMGFADLNSAIEYNATNPNAMIKGGMVPFDAAPFSILTLKHKGISAPKDLEGKTLGAPQFDASFRLFPAFCAATGIDRSKVRVQAITPPLRETMLVRGEVDFITGHFYTSILELLARGVPANDIVVDPARALAALKATEPLVDGAIEAERLRMALADNVLTERVRRDGWGGAGQDRLAASIEQVSAAPNLPRRTAPADLFDASFLPPAAERMLT